ncbi:hypothetical protein [Streptomyces sp. EN23]|uniref:hypothetical protein n=1 Tax=Streptomyces sp. EN23 TaxID=212774 RepID=UPI000851F57E|nr:hypothetical protein [Streptomyces sp. EN23]
MADIGISYDASVAPAPLRVRVRLSLSGTTIRATLEDVPPFVAALRPVGNVGELILSGAAWPVAQTLAVLLPPVGHRLLQGQTFDLLPLPAPPPLHVKGHSLTPVLDSPSLSSRGGMLSFTATPRLA